MFEDYKDVVTVKELQKMLGVSRVLAYKLITSGKIPAVKVGRQYKIAKVHVAEYICGEKQ